MAESNNLKHLISQKTLPRALGITIVLFIVLLFAGILYIHEQLEAKHQSNIEVFKVNFRNSIGNIQTQVQGVARNDLIINSLIDFSNRDDYLPLFFRSLDLTVEDDIAIAFTDFSGKIITGKNLSLYQEKENIFNWKNSVLDNSKDVAFYGNNGAFFASPILYSNFPEGAIIAYIPSLQSIVKHISPDQTTLLLDGNNNILYISDQTVLHTGSIFSEENFNLWHIDRVVVGDYSIVSMEPMSQAYAQVIWLLLIMVASLVVILYGAISSTRLAAKLASEALNQLQDTISQATQREYNVDNKPITVPPMENEPTEFAYIRVKYNELLESLTHTTISRDKFEGVINSMSELLLVIDEEGDIILSNQSFNKFSDAVGHPNIKSFSPIFPTNFLASEIDNSTFELIYDHTENHKEDLGPTCSIRWQRHPYTNENGLPLGFIFVGNDITRAKQIKADLMIKNKAVDEAQTSILIVDAQQPDLPITYANEAFEELTGYEYGEIIGKNCRFLQGKDTEPETVDAIRDAIKNKKPISTTLLNYKKDGSPFYNYLTISPILDDRGKVTHFLGLQTDVTEREKTTRYLNEAKNKAEDSAKLKSEFLASMSHEIRTPMNGILGMLQLLLRTNLNQEQEHQAQLAKNSADALLTIINDILDFSKVEAGKLDIETIEFDIQQLLGDVIESIALKAQDKGIELVLDISNIKAPKVGGDPSRVRQVLNNLIGNAIKFTESGEIVVAAHLATLGNGKCQLRCSVSDTGIGIAPDRLPSIFETFTQADASTTREYGGTGLGLAICKQLCQLMDGDIQVSSHLGKGSTFEFSLVLDEVDQSRLSVPHIDIVDAPILVVDSSRSSRIALRKQLESWGALVTEASSASEALALLAENEFRVAFIEMFMEEINGEELGQQIRANNQWNNCALILMTTLHQRGDARHYAEIGFNAYFPKPATFNDLRNALEIVLDAGETLQQAKPLITSHYLAELTQDKTASNNPGPSQIQKNQSTIPILLVDDNLTNQIVAEAMLEELGGEITTAANGIEALEILNKSAEKPFSLIFMDCQMPEMDGYETTQRIRNGEGGQCYVKSPIIAMTANAMKGDRERCLDAGMDDYIAKPVEAHELANKISHWSKST